jgi:DNA-binding beta-propeller fold protein YncE
MPVNSPLAGKDEIKDIKWKNFQLMKIKDNKLEWIENTDLKEFKEKAVNPPSQKKSPDYIGKNFEKSLAYATPEGEVIISGQKYTTQKVPDPESNVEGATIKVKDEYKDLVMFHFDSKGVLKAQYGVKRDKNNKYSKANLTPQYIYLNKDNSELYWIYGEIKGFRKGFEIKTDIMGFGGSVGISKSKLLFYPTVAKINLKDAKVNDFVPLGADENGKQVYYTNPEFLFCALGHPV